MTPAQQLCLDTLESVVAQANAIGCDCTPDSPVNEHTQWCHRPRVEALLELMRGNFTGSEVES